jgi:hypothetical protein
MQRSDTKQKGSRQPSPEHDQPPVTPELLIILEIRDGTPGVIFRGQWSAA